MRVMRKDREDLKRNLFIFTIFLSCHHQVKTAILQDVMSNEERTTDEVKGEEVNRGHLGQIENKRADGKHNFRSS